MRVLLIEDSAHLRAVLEDGLSAAGLRVCCAGDAAAGLALAEAARPDAVVLDGRMPGGADVLRALRGRGDEVHVILVTTATEAGIRGLEQGADDFVSEPLEVREVAARIRAAARRRAPASIVAGELCLDPRRRVARLGERRVHTSPLEFELLLALAERRGEALSRAELLERVWDTDFDPGTNLVAVLVARLRRKLGQAGPRLIRTVYGRGYRLDGGD